MDEAPLVEWEEWIDPLERKAAIIKRFEERANNAFREWLLAHKSENELKAMVMEIFTEILEEEDLHQDRKLMEIYMTIGRQIHSACGKQEKQLHRETAKTTTILSKIRAKFEWIFRKAA